MMVLNLKSYHKYAIAAVFLASCGDAPELTPHRCQAIFVLDKTNSVAYPTGSTDLKNVLVGEFQRTYGSKTTGIQCSRLIIKGNTQVFPEIDRFNETYPDGPDDDRSIQQRRQKWNMQKRKWMFDEAQLVDSLIHGPCNANTTDIFSIFSGIQQVQQNNNPWDSINVFIFSDMVNTTSRGNMLTIKAADVYERGKSMCQDMLQQKQISPVDSANLYLNIYAPRNMTNSAAVQQFWDGFFWRWGLPKSHYQFETL